MNRALVWRTPKLDETFIRVAATRHQSLTLRAIAAQLRSESSKLRLTAARLTSQSARMRGAGSTQEGIGVDLQRQASEIRTQFVRIAEMQTLLDEETDVQRTTAQSSALFPANE